MCWCCHCSPPLVVVGATMLGCAPESKLRRTTYNPKGLIFNFVFFSFHSTYRIFFLYKNVKKPDVIARSWLLVAPWSRCSFARRLRRYALSNTKRLRGCCGVPRHQIFSSSSQPQPHSLVISGCRMFSGLKWSGPAFFLLSASWHSFGVVIHLLSANGSWLLGKRTRNHEPESPISRSTRRKGNSLICCSCIGTYTQSKVNRFSTILVTGVGALA